MSAQQHPQLKHGLSNRHIQLIALGGSIGTGLFLGISQTIKLAGPSVILGYALAGLIAFFMMRQLGEMVVEEPVSGSFSYFAYKFWSPFAGFMSGWNYWVLNVLVCMAELSAIGLYVQYWWPEIPTWISALGFFVLINAINLLHVKVFGETEFLFSMIKILAIIGMIGYGAWLLASGHGGAHASISNLWALGGFFPNGISGLIMAMAIIMFSFGGIELVGIAAAETKNPTTTIPKAVNQIVYRVLLFYVLTIIVLLSLFPWNQIAEGGSPFVLIFDSLCSALVTLLCVVLNYIFPEKAFKLLMSLVVSAIVINWMMLALTHLKFKQRMLALKKSTLFPTLIYPISNYICIVFMLGILVVMWLTHDMRIAVMLIPLWIGCLTLTYWFKQRSKMQKIQ